MMITRITIILCISFIGFFKSNAQTMKTKNILVNGETLSYIDSEKGSTTLLFIHGAFIDKEYWTDQLAYFAPNYRVIAFDLAGHGSSSHNRTDWTVQTFGKGLSQFIERLKLDDIVLIGHSFGSDIMLEVVNDYPAPVIGLIEVDHMKSVGAVPPKENVDQLVAGLKADFKGTCEHYAKQALLTERTDPKLVAKLLEDFGDMDPEVGIPIFRDNVNYPLREAELLRRLELKLHLVHVNYMPTNEESLKKYLGDNYKLYKMNGTCHYPMLENPEDFNFMLEKILMDIARD